MKHIAACIFGLLLSGFSTTLPPPTYAAVWDALSSPTPTLISESAPTWKPQPTTITGKVVAIADGATITVLDANNQQHKIRLDGIDAPESAQDFGSLAKRSLSDLVFGKTVIVTSSKKDRYGRTVGKVTLDGKDINLEQINRGMAWLYRYYAKELSRDDATAYEAAEERARREKRGLWIDPSPVAPWDFRREPRPTLVKRPDAKPSSPAPAAGQVIGNRASKIYHLPICPDYSTVSERNRVPFASEADAQAAGYRKARNCP